jgi:hypothetical protein
MESEKNLASLWVEFTLLGNIDQRRIIVSQDVQDASPKFRNLAEDNPYRFFELLGGDLLDIECSNWAMEYTYEDYLEDNELPYDNNEAENWNLIDRSIELAEYTTHWYVTGICILKGPENIELPFEFDYCDGLIDCVIGTPYNKAEHGGHGIQFN